jgi:hypothetical protein
MSSGWTPERRARQAEAIRRWQPWTKSTGPRTARGKARAAANGLKNPQHPGMRSILRELRRALREQRTALSELRDVEFW